MLLMYDAYRSHMTLRVLKHLLAHNIIVYGLLSHTSGRTQSCETGVFRNLKQAVNDAMFEVGRAPDAIPMNIYELCALLHYTYRCAFTTPNLMSAFVAAEV